MKEFSVTLRRFEDKVNTVRYSARISDADLRRMPVRHDGETLELGGLVSDLYISWGCF